MNALRHLPNPAEGLKPVKRVLFEEFLNLPIIAEFGATLLKVTDLIPTRVLNIQSKAGSTCHDIAAL